MKRFIADLHIHSCLSPCAELDMTPKRIIDMAIQRGVDIIAISDHNSAENLPAAMATAAEKGITLLPAMEITSSEEVHVLAVFGTLEAAGEMQRKVYENLAGGLNDERLWGYQAIVDENDEVVELNRRLLIGATRIALKELVEDIRSFGGLAIAGHAERESFSVTSQLGFIPPDIQFDALETTGRGKLMPDRRGNMPWIASSDAHHLGDIGKNTTAYLLESPSFQEVAMALKGINGRKVLLN